MDYEKLLYEFVNDIKDEEDILHILKLNIKYNTTRTEIEEILVKKIKINPTANKFLKACRELDIENIKKYFNIYFGIEWYIKSFPEITDEIFITLKNLGETAEDILFYIKNLEKVIYFIEKYKIPSKELNMHLRRAFECGSPHIDYFIEYGCRIDLSELIVITNNIEYIKKYHNILRVGKEWGAAYSAAKNGKIEILDFLLEAGYSPYEAIIYYYNNGNIEKAYELKDRYMKESEPFLYKEIIKNIK